MSDTMQSSSPFIDTTGEHPTATPDYKFHEHRCYGSSSSGGECELMDLSFNDIDEWREHRSRHHPVGCSESGCNILSAYKQKNSPSSYCFKHVPDDPDVVYKWHRTNEKSVVPPPKASEDHPIESGLRGLEA